MNGHRPNSSGFSLIELMLVAWILVLIFLGIVHFFSGQIPFWSRIKTRQQVMVDSRICMDTIIQMLRNGKAQTLVISSPGNPPVPNSQIDFSLQSPLPSGAVQYRIALVNGTVLATELPAQASKKLASNVTGLMFTGDSRDPGVVSVTLQMDVPYDTTNDPTHVSSILLSNQIARMVESP
jgi:hypothetical protein